MPRKIAVKEGTVFTNRVVSVSITQTINTGDYESIKVYAGFSGMIPDETNLVEAYADAYNIVIDELDKQVAKG